MTIATAVYIAAESTFATDPSADGSGYTAVATTGPVSPWSRTQTVLSPDRATGRARRQQMRPGPDGASITLRMPYRGFASAAGVGSSPATTDALDLILNSAFGAGSNVAGIAGNASTTTTLFVQAGAGNSLDPGDALAHYTPGTFGDRIQWRTIDVPESTGGQYAHRAVTGPVGASSISYGYRRWSPASVPYAGAGASLAVHVVMTNGDQWTLLGGRPSQIAVTANAGEEAHIEATIMFDRVSNGDKASLPTVAAFTPAAIVATQSTIVVGGTSYETNRVRITWQLGTADQRSVTGDNARSNILPRTADVDIEIAPPLAAAWESDFTGQTARRVEITIGSAAVSGGAANSCHFIAEHAQPSAWSIEDDNNQPRNVVPLTVVDRGTYASGALARYWSFCRA
jgi:hypothetical protein